MKTWLLIHVIVVHNCFLLILDLIFSGLLTGKYERGVFPDDPSSSRIAWVEADQQSRSNQSHPSLSQYSNKEEFWQLLDVLKEIATKHGELLDALF